MTIELGRSVTGVIDLAAEREWLVTNGLGGYASGTVAGARTRRYHGLLVAALEPPLDRYLLLAGIDAWVDIGNRRVPISTHEWAAGVIFPDGYRHLEQFRLEGNLPVYRWTVGITAIEQRIWMAHGENTTYITWHYERGTGPIRLVLKPLISYRSHHDTTVGGKTVRVTPIPPPWKHGSGIDILAIEYLGKDEKTILPIPFRILVTKGSLSTNGDWWWSFQLREEKARGLHSQEDLYQVGTIEVTLEPGEQIGMVCTAEASLPETPQVALQKEQERLISLQQAAGCSNSPSWIQNLVLAADQFIVDGYNENDEAETLIISGYPWFSIWFRDMLAGLGGLTTAVGRPQIAAQILRSSLNYSKTGLLPNMIDENAKDEKHRLSFYAIDSTLWFFVALWTYLRDNPDDTTLLPELYPQLRTLLQSYIKGTHFRIGEDPTDGLLFGGERDAPLTWMDVKIEKWVVTPRTGKAVEVNALWYNALRIMQDFAERLGQHADLITYTTRAQRVLQSFNNLFWYEGKGYLYDVIGIADKPNDSTLRPNQLFALSLPYRVLTDAERSRNVVDICARELLISYGLRTLSPDDKQFIGQYAGSPEQRDRAYHQGTVWAWLIGHFVSAHLAVYNDPVAARSFLEPFANQMRTYGIGTVPEIFDAHPPFRARGAIAHAWSVAEILRAWREIERFAGA